MERGGARGAGLEGTMKRTGSVWVWSLAVLALAAPCVTAYGAAAAGEPRAAGPQAPVAPSGGPGVVGAGAVAELGPGPEDVAVTRVVGNLMQHGHYLQQELNDEVSRRFLERYLDALDYFHSQFLAEDVAQFAPLATALDDLTLRGDSRPAYLIYQRYLERLAQRVEYVTAMLKEGRLDFTAKDRYRPDRHDLPRPATIEEAKRLWLDRLRYEVLAERLAGKKEAEIVDLISGRYQRMLKFERERDREDILQTYLTALAHVYDPHSDYLGPGELENFGITMQLYLFGIGAVLKSEDGYCKIVELVPGGPADRDGKLKPNDRIIAVAQGAETPAVDVVDMHLNKVVRMIRGPKGTEVRLTVIPANAADSAVRKYVNLVRDEIPLEKQEAKAVLHDRPAPGGGMYRLAVIDLSSFYADMGMLDSKRGPGARRKSTTEDVRKLLEKLRKEGVDGVVLDLRRNGGGSLEEAINLTGLFIDQGPVVQVRDNRGKVAVNSDTAAGAVYDGPLVVLTSRVSASASEILAGALQDYRRAVIVGDSSTHGKGTVQSMVQLDPFLRQVGASPDEKRALKITVQKFYRATGSSTQLKGVTPDIVVPSMLDYDEIGEKSLPNPLPWDEIKAADFRPDGRLGGEIAELRRRSVARVAAEPEFAYIREDMERIHKQLADKTVSLNEEERRREKAENKARAEARGKERSARAKPPEPVITVTVKDAGQPGLPKPVMPTNAAPASAPADGEEGEEAEEEDRAPEAAGVDAVLDEGLAVLADLIGVQGGGGPVVAKTAAP